MRSDNPPSEFEVKRKRLSADCVKNKRFGEASALSVESDITPICAEERFVDVTAEVPISVKPCGYKAATPVADSVTPKLKTDVLKRMKDSVKKCSTLQQHRKNVSASPSKILPTGELVFTEANISNCSSTKPHPTKEVHVEVDHNIKNLTSPKQNEENENRTVSSSPPFHNIFTGFTIDQSPTQDLKKNSPKSDDASSNCLTDASLTNSTSPNKTQVNATPEPPDVQRTPSSPSKCAHVKKFSDFDFLQMGSSI